MEKGIINYYIFLGITPGATDDDIIAAANDKISNIKDTVTDHELRLQQTQEVYDIKGFLLNPEKRAAYNQSLGVLPESEPVIELDIVQTLGNGVATIIAATIDVDDDDGFDLISGILSIFSDDD